MIKTPCIGVCSSTLGDSVCRGCNRFDHEVVAWNSMSDEQKVEVLRRIGRLMTNIARHFFLIETPELFEEALKEAGVVYRKDMPVAAWTFDLLRVNTSFDPARFHITVNSPYHKVGLPTLRKLMFDWLYNDSRLLRDYEKGAS